MQVQGLVPIAGNDQDFLLHKQQCCEPGESGSQRAPIHLVLICVTRTQYTTEPLSNFAGVLQAFAFSVWREL